MLSMGIFPSVGLSEAKEARDAAKKLLAQGINPSQEHKVTKSELKNAWVNIFSTVVDEWLKHQVHRARVTINKVRFTIIVENNQQQIGLCWRR